MTPSGETKETLSGRVPRDLKARCVALATRRNVPVTVVMTELLERGFASLEGTPLNGHPVPLASPPTEVGGLATPLVLEVQERLSQLEQHSRAHARANRLAVQAVIGSLLADSSDEIRAAAREFLVQSYAGLEPLEEQS